MKIIIIGCGRVGAGLAKVLSLQKIDVVVIDQDPTAFERLGPTFKGKTVTGIGFDEKVLLDAGIKTADALAAVTHSDEANLVAARLAKVVFKVPRVAARVYEPNKAKIFRRLGLQTISPVTLGIERMADLLASNVITPEKLIGAGQVMTVDLDVPDKLVGHQLSEISTPSETLVIGITRVGKTFIPNLATRFEKDDLVHIAVTVAALPRVKKLFL
jgi:trk system potassium uptake protein TrkA